MSAQISARAGAGPALQKSKLFAALEILVVYIILQTLGIALRSTGIAEWEVRNLGWSYTGSILFIGVPALVIWLRHRDGAAYGLSLANWRTNLEVGIKAYLVRIIPAMFLLGTLLWLHLDYRVLPGGAVVALGEFIGIVIMLLLLNRQQDMKAASGRSTIITTILLLLFPIAVALLMSRLSLIIVSTVIWQFVFSGFGEEFVWRGYVQSRLNQAFGRPYHFLGIPFGVGLIITSLLFGLLHAFNTYDPAQGLVSLSWGWALFTSLAGLFFGMLREKTGTLLASGIAHGLPDAVGEALAKLFGWM